MIADREVMWDVLKVQCEWKLSTAVGDPSVCVKTCESFRIHSGLNRWTS